VSPLLAEYLTQLQGKAAGTLDAYQRVLRQFLGWLAERPGGSSGFAPDQFTATAVETYLEHLGARGYSVSHRARVKAGLNGFARWLIEEQGVLRRNPVRGVVVPAQALLAPRELSPDQRYVLRTLVEREGSLRGAAIFALGYWAGCRVSDVAWLRREHTHVGPRTGWLRVGYKGGKEREIDLANAARKPLYAYLEHGAGQRSGAYVFSSQRAARLSEAGIHHWFRSLKDLARRQEWELVHDVTFHDLRHDFAHRARAVGWSLEEVAYYLGHVTKQGRPAIQTTARYTQVSRAAVKHKLQTLPG
jgi:site-specific recombinase XerD